jgi:hypothetical protein
MEKTINDRIGELITALKKNHKTFAESIGKSPTVIYNTVNGRNKPSFDVLESICEVYPQVNTTWLLKGEGEMMVTESKQIDVAPDAYLQAHIRRLEQSFSNLANQLEVKDKQIEGLQRTVDVLLGKSRGVSIEPVCETEFHSKKGVPTPFFMPFKRKFGYTPSNSMVAGSF